jgi:hypothetical protein
MLLSTGATGVFSVPLKARHQRRVPSQGVGVKDGLGISPLRATSGPPSISQTAPRRTGSLVKPPQAGGGVLSKLQGAVRSTSPLTPGVRIAHRFQAKTAGLLQAGQSSLTSSFRKIDRDSRLLQASASPFRLQGGFGAQLGTSSLNLLG